VLLNGWTNEHVCKKQTKDASVKEMEAYSLLFSLSGLVHRVYNNYEEHVFYHLINQQSSWLAKLSILQINVSVYQKTTDSSNLHLFIPINTIFGGFNIYFLIVKREI